MATKKHPPGFSLAGIPKPALHTILHNLLMQQIHAAASHPGLIYKVCRRHRFTLFQYYKNYRLLSRLKGSALSLLQTQFAKKPKNPV